MISVIQNGVNLIGINSFWQGSVTGLVILVEILIDRLTKTAPSFGAATGAHSPFLRRKLQ